MTAATFAAIVTPDPATQVAIVGLLDRDRFAERELDAVLIVFEAYLEGVRAAGGSVDSEMLLRAGATAVDTVWAFRGQKARVVQ